jgi:hypothetical protein
LAVIDFTEHGFFLFDGHPINKAVFANHVAKVDGAPKILGAYNFCLSSRLAGYFPYLTGIGQSQQLSLRTQPLINGEPQVQFSFL